MTWTSMPQPSHSARTKAYTGPVAQRAAEGIRGPVAFAGGGDLAAVELQPRRNVFDLAVAGFMRDAMLDIGQRRLALQVLAVECRLDRDRRQLLAARVGDGLDHLAELDLQQARQGQSEIALEQEGDAALARLAVDANDRFVGAAEVGRIDRQVRDFPGIGRLAGSEAFLD